MKETFRVVAIDETHCWQDAILAEYHIARAFGLYGVRVRDIDGSIDVGVEPLENAFIFDFDLDPSLAAAAIDGNLRMCMQYCMSGGRGCDFLWALRSHASDKLSFEGMNERDYIDAPDFAKDDSRFFTAPMTFTMRAGDYKGGSKSREYRDDLLAAFRQEIADSGFPDIPILHRDVFLAYEAEQTAKARSEMTPVLAGGYFNGGQLQLFVAQSRRMIESDVLATNWVDPWHREYYARHPDELAEADAKRAAQIAEFGAVQ